jgi:hypothetical protein
MSRKSKGNMPFCPRVPNDQVIPAVAPGHYKKAQGIVIKNVHAIVFDTSLYASTGSGPFGQFGTSVVVSHDHSVQRLTVFKYGQ